MSPASKYCTQEQEDKILAAAAQCIEETSLLDFTMSMVANLAGVSMGSVYKHVHSKEDILVALATLNSRQLHQTFSCILSTSLSAPEQLISISLLNFNRIDLYPFSRYLEILVSNEALLNRASINWREKLLIADEQLESLFQQHFQKLVKKGELIPEGDEDIYSEQLYFGIWAINVGYIQVVLQTHAQDNTLPKTLPFPLAENSPHVLNTQRLINCYQWRQPLNAHGISKAAITLKELGFR